MDDFDEDQPLWGVGSSPLPEAHDGHSRYDASLTGQYNYPFEQNPSPTPARVLPGPYNPQAPLPTMICPSSSTFNNLNKPFNAPYKVPMIPHIGSWDQPPRPPSIPAPPVAPRQQAMSAAKQQPISKQGSEDYGDEIWDDAHFVMAADQSIQDEASVVGINDPVATVDLLQQRDELKNSVVPNKRGRALVPVARLPYDQRQLFKFPSFNDVQSVVFEDAYNGDENLVVSAPTGSGKTTIFELAFLHNLSFKTPDLSTKPLAVYIAPTKALCNEKARDWHERMGHALSDVTCTEITGDFGNVSTIYNSIKGADLIVTTPEKFDSITRRSKNLENISQRLRLIMIDEVHILRESRGATLEVVISRMKGLAKGIRFVALSATVPNIDDIARWLGPSRIHFSEFSRGVTHGDHTNDTAAESFSTLPMAKVHKFGEEYRPVPLTRETYGIDGGGNEWALANKLDRELFPILLRHTNGKPVLVFCPTRKSCQATAQLIFSLYEEARAKGLKLPWQHPPGVRLDLQDKKIAELSTCGIAVHHAGLDYSDRRAIEDGFRDGKLHMIASTSTLAVGVNLPAHTVVIKGVMAWQGPSSGFKEYSDIDILQMVGRAGRPQYDKSGVVVVMCERAKVRKYQSMLHSQTLLESCLHDNLTEYINSEIGQGTITSVSSAQEWLRNSFFYIRIQQNPKHYALPDAKNKPAGDSWEGWLDHYVEEALINLEKDGFITRADDEMLSPTESGRIMSSSMISYGTMCSIKDMSPKSSLQDLLEILAGATEFKDLRIRQGEAGLLNKLRENQEIRFPLTETVKNYADKVFLMLQVTFGNVFLDEIAKKTEITSPVQTLMAIYTHAPRIAKAIVQFALNKEYGTATRSALELHRTVVGKAWEDSPTVFRQITSIGPKSIKVLGQNGISTFDQLLDVEGQRIQLWLNRGHDFVRTVHDQARRMPRFHVTIDEDGLDHDGVSYILNLRIIIRPKAKVIATESKGKRGGYQTLYNLSTLFLRQNGSFIGYRRLELKKLKGDDTSFVMPVILDRRCEKVVAVVAVDEVAGCATVAEYETNLDDSVYPATMEDDGDTPEPSQITLVEATPEPPEDLLPNGNVPCHHSCKDKQACNHGCCKIGVPVKSRARVGKSAGKGNVKTAADRLKEAHGPTDNAPTKLVAKAVSRIRTQRTASRSLSPSVESQQRPKGTIIRMPSLCNEGTKPKAVARARKALDSRRSASPSVASQSRQRAMSRTSSLGQRNRPGALSKEPLFIPKSDDDRILSSDQELIDVVGDAGEPNPKRPTTSRYFRQSPKPSYIRKIPTPRPSPSPSPSIVDVLSSPDLPAKSVQPPNKKGRRNQSKNVNDGIGTPSKIPSPSPPPRSDPTTGVERWTELNGDMVDNVPIPSTDQTAHVAEADDPWDFDVDGMFSDVKAVSPPLSPTRECSSRRPPPTTQLKRKPSALNIGGFGKFIKRVRGPEAPHSPFMATRAHHRTNGSPQPTQTPAQEHSDEESGDKGGLLNGLDPQAQQQPALAPFVQDEVDEFEQWYLGGQ